VQAQQKAAARVDLAVDQGRDAPEVLSVEAPGPCRFSQDLLHHKRVDVDEAELKELKRKHTDLLGGLHDAALPKLRMSPAELILWT
jgi:hypothetical protein